jgi:hypothetical protein
MGAKRACLRVVRRLHDERPIGDEHERGGDVASDHDAERRAHMRAAILRHLQHHHLAGDTADGIVASWLPPQGYEDAARHVDAVVEAMVAAGELLPQGLPGGKVLYLRGPRLSGPA